MGIFCNQLQTELFLRSKLACGVKFAAPLIFPYSRQSPVNKFNLLHFYYIYYIAMSYYAGRIMQTKFIAYLDGACIKTSFKGS